MKTKLLSKLMLMACTAVMIAGCGDGSIKTPLAIAPPIERCVVCNQTDDHMINPDTAARMIRDFHNKILRNKNISNAGGFFSTNLNPHFAPDSIKNINDYRSFKLHWAIEDTTNPMQRLFITLEPSNRLCGSDNRYSGSAGIEDDRLQTTYGINDINPIGPVTEDITTTKVLERLRGMFKVDARRDYFRPVEKADAIHLLEAFNDHNDLFGLYQCEDIVFNKEKSLDQITLPNRRSFFYFFGYDEKQTYHRLRLIIVGYNILAGEYTLKIFDATTGLSLLRETSRPRP